MCLYDFPQGGLLSDDEMYTIFQDRRWGTRVSVFSDSCFSGTLARFMPGPAAQRGKPRFMPPSEFLTGQDLGVARAIRSTSAKDISRSGTVLISGCSENEYSYDAYIDDKPQGAFSAYATQTYQHGLTMAKWYKAIRKRLPIDTTVYPNVETYPQTPLLTAAGWQRYWSL
jgi:hypothetical protein